MTEKKKIRVSAFSIYDLVDKTVEEALEIINTYVTSEETNRKISISEVKIEDDLAGSYDTDLLVVVYRDETDEEFEKRLKKNEEARKKRAETERKKKKEKEDADRKTYERLKKKFG